MQSLRFTNETLSNPRQEDSGGMGDGRLSANNDADHRRPTREASAGPPKRRRGDPPGAVSRALRTVYDDTLREDVPDDFLDLLGKLS